MELNFKNLPIVGLPYETINSCKNMMLKLYKDNPFLAELNKVSNTDNIFTRTYSNIPGININKNKLSIIKNTSSKFTEYLNILDNIYKSNSTSAAKDLKSDIPYYDIYIKILKKLQPSWTVINLLGPFSSAYSIKNENIAVLLTDRLYRKFLIQAIIAKALYYINEIKINSPNTQILLVLDEPYLNKFGNLKQNDIITDDDIILLFSKIVQKMHSIDTKVCIQSFTKCNWILPINSGVDMISFDAYNNPNNLSIIPDKIKEFLNNGGYINFGIIPTSNENIIKTTNIDEITNKYNKIVSDLSSKGISANLIHKYTTISPQGKIDHLPVMFAEKSIILCNQLANKIYSKHLAQAEAVQE